MLNCYCPYCGGYHGEWDGSEFWCPECGRRAEIDYPRVLEDYGPEKAKRDWGQQERERGETKQMTLGLGAQHG